MKEKELREVAKCNVCGKPIGHTGLPTFWRVRFDRYFVSVDAIKRQDGLAAMLGGHTELARVMGPDDDMAKKISTKEITVCEDCGMDQYFIAVLALEE